MFHCKLFVWKWMVASTLAFQTLVAHEFPGGLGEVWVGFSRLQV